MNIEEADIRQAVIENGRYIGHVHIADSNRYQPGQAHLDFKTLFSALSEIGYSGDIVFECRVIGDNPVKRYGESCAFIRDLLRSIER